MGTIQILDKRYNASLGYNVQWVLFECPMCKTQEEKPKNLADNVTHCKTCANIVAKNKRIKHAGAIRGKETPLYKIWRGIKSRCYTKSDSAYENYGAKGITMCDEWKNNYKAFETWALDNGYLETLHIDKDELCEQHGIQPHIYAPNTCQWVMQHKNNVIESQLHTNEIEYEMVNKYTSGATIKSLADEYYIGIGVSVSAPGKYVEEVLKRYGVYKPRMNRASIPDKLIEQILLDPRPLTDKLTQHCISKSKWHRAITKYKQKQN